MTRNKRTLSDIDCSGEAVSIEWSQRSCKRRYQRPITPTTEPLLRDSVSRRQEKTKHSLVRSWLDTVLANENLAEQLTGTSSGPISVTGNGKWAMSVMLCLIWAIMYEALMSRQSQTVGKLHIVGLDHYRTLSTYPSTTRRYHTKISVRWIPLDTQ